MRRDLNSLVRLTSSVALLCVLAGCAPLTASFLDPHGPVAAKQRDLLFDIIGWMTIVVVPVLILVPLLAWRYRRRNKLAAYRPEWKFSWPLEFLIWGVPVAVVAVMAWMIWTQENPLDPYAPLPSPQPPLEIEVVGLDWKWLFIYPDQHIATVGQLALPVDRLVHFRLTSDTVMQSFFIPALGSQIYAMAGMVTQLNLKAGRLGDLRGLNTQYNGDGFHKQTFDVAVVPARDFVDWVETVRSRGTPLDEAAYRLLERKSAPVSALYFAPAAPRLFGAVVAKYRHGAGAGDKQHMAASP
jgi:cytochrome o ubiquinol oxidase subunit 2